MIRYLAHNEIDRTRWDDCIARSVNRRVYAFSWYLDIVSPGWEALAEEDYSLVFPLPVRKKWGVNYLAQPWFTQQLGLFSPAPVTKETMVRVLGALPEKFRFAEVQFNAVNPPYAPAGEIRLRANYELSLSPAATSLVRQYDQNTRRNLKKAQEKGVELLAPPGVREITRLFRENFGKQEGKLRAGDYAMLNSLLTACLDRGLGEPAGAGQPGGGLSAAAFVVNDRERVYFLFAASAPAARANGAMFFLVDHLIRRFAGSVRVFDFEGGSDPGVARFYRGFGAVAAPYPVWRLNRLKGATGAAHSFLERFRQR